MEFLEQLLYLNPVIILLIIGGICFLEGLPVIGTLVAGGTFSVGIGALGSKDLIDIVPAFIVCAMGVFLGDIVGYFVIKKYKFKVKRLEKLVKSIEDHDSKFSRFFEQNYFLVTILSKLIPVVRSLPSLFAAVRNINVAWYVCAALMASVTWALTGILVGYGFGSLISAGQVFILLGLLVVVPAVIGITRFMFKKITKKI